MIYRMQPLDDDWLTEGVLARRVVAWFLDALLICAIMVAMWFGLLLFGVITLGLGMPLLGVLPFVPFCYHLFSLLGPMSATPGQTALGLVVRRNDDFGRPMPLQAIVSTLLYYITLATTGLLLLVALFTVRRRTLHDLASGLVVVRAQRLNAGTLTGGPRSWNMQGGSPYA